MKDFRHKFKIASLIEDELPREGQTVYISIVERDPYKGARKKRRCTVLILAEYPDKYLTLHLDNIKFNRRECFLKKDFTYGMIDFKIIGWIWWKNYTLDDII